MNELAEHLAITAELTGTSLSEGAAVMLAQELAEYPRDQVLGALRKCRRELKGRLTMAAVIERLDDGRPGPDEAWAMIPMNESASVVWTEEMSAAWGVAARLMDRDQIAARMAFRDAYQRLVAEARDRREPAKWTPSLGHDPRGRDEALRRAVELGRITPEFALGLNSDLPIQIPAAVLVALGGGPNVRGKRELPEGEQR